MFGNLPADGLDAVASLRKAGDAPAVVVPAVGKAAVWPAPNLLSVEQEDEALVGGDVDVKRLAIGRGFEVAAEAQEDLRLLCQRFGRRPGFGEDGAAPAVAALAPDPRCLVDWLLGRDVRVAARVAFGAEDA